MSATDTPTPRERILRLATERRISLTTLSRLIGRNTSYIQQYVERGSPRRLPEEERLRLAMYFGIDERLLGARDPWVPPTGPSL